MYVRRRLRPVRLSRGERRDLLTEYELLFFRELEQESKIWTTPAIALTAQAFLFTVALAPDSSPVARIATSALAIAVSLASVQLMSKNFLLAHLDKLRMKEIDDLIGRHGLEERGWDDALWRIAHDMPATNPWYLTIKSRLLWESLLGSFAVVAAGVIVTTIFWPQLFASLTP
ncbi:MAG: putative rane protein [Schumannella sp.]|nr:putative rane protein [Schumannella sp.]